MMNLVEMERIILGDVWTSSSLWNSVSYLCDVCHGRLSGTENERSAGDFLLSKFQEYGLRNVAAEPFDIPHWVRDETQFSIFDGQTWNMVPCLAMSGTPAGEIEGNLIDIGPGTAADFEKFSSTIKGAIILTGPGGMHHLEKYVKAQEMGAAAIILAQGQPGAVISASSLGLRAIEPVIPIVGIQHEFAAFIRRQIANHPLKGRLSVKGGRTPGQGRNIIAEIPGQNQDEGWIIACGHYDGHDLGQAAQDNASGTVIILEAARVLQQFRDQFKCGIRFVLFSGEEEGIYGSPAFVASHPEDWDHIRFVYNADIVGCTTPLVLKTQNSPELASYLKLLPLGDMGAVLDENDFISNSDHFSFTARGISSLWAVTSPAPQGTYWVHSPYDTLDKLDPSSLKAAAVTTARILLRMVLDSEKLPRGRKSHDEVIEAITAKGWEKLLRLQKRYPD